MDHFLALESGTSESKYSATLHLALDKRFRDDSISLSDKEPNMKIEIQRNSDAIIISIEGSLELKFVRELKSQLIDIVQNEDMNIEINLSKADYMDSTGIGVLLNVYKIQKSKGKSIKLIEVNPRIQRALKLSNLTELFNMQ